MSITEMIQTDETRPELVRAELAQADFETRLRFGLSEVLNERPELRDALPLAAMMDDALRWCA
jgi:hypothetical protein